MKLIRKLLLGIFSITLLAIPIVSLAQNVSITGVIDIYLSGPGLTYKLRGGTFASITVTSNSFTIATGSGDTVTVSSFEGKSLENNGNLTVECFGTESRIVIGASTSVTFTPTGSIVCTGSSSGGGGSSGGASSASGGGGSSGGGVVSLPVVNQRINFKDVYGKLKKTDVENISKIVQLMLDQKTYRNPSTSIYGTKTITTYGFALKTALALKGISCGSSTEYPSIAACKKAAVDAGLISEDLDTRARIPRKAYYELLLKSVDQKLINASVSNLKEICSDASSASLKDAKIFFTARSLGITSIYVGNKCQLNLFLSRAEVAKFATRALDVKTK